MLAPWLRERPSFVATVRRVGAPDMHAAPLAAEDSWALYALSRVVDLLLLDHQPARNDEAAWVGPGAYGALADAFGGWWPHGAAYHPFLHEIVEVVPADDPAEPPSVVREWWPGFLCNALLVTRGGVTVRAGAEVLDPCRGGRLAAVLTWRRRYRRAVDLSHGWGSNSQWRTGFRRDYLADGAFHYNVDGAGRPDDHWDGLTPAEVADLVRYRAGTLVDRGGDAWPFDTRVRDRATI
ncbi:hypothetical protein ACFQX7_38745 [Luedemannella flava]